MCLKPERIYDKDQDYLSKIKKKQGLRSRAMALRKILAKFREHKMEGEL